MGAYYTVVVPWVPAAFRSEWHPDAAMGPFSVLTRGAFKTTDEAIAWGRDHLRGAPYSIKQIAQFEDENQTTNDGETK